MPLPVPATIPLAYLATPYSHPDPVVRERRYEEACRAARVIAMNRRYVAYSPVVYWHPIAVKYKLPTDAVFWATQNFGMMYAANVIIVVTFDGWQESKGVAMEIDFAKRNEKALIYVDPNTLVD